MDAIKGTPTAPTGHTLTIWMKGQRREVALEELVPGDQNTNSPSLGWSTWTKTTTWPGKGTPITELVLLVPGDQNHQVAVGELAPGSQEHESALQANPVQDYPGRLSPGVDRVEDRRVDRAVDRQWVGTLRNQAPRPRRPRESFLRCAG